MILSRTHIFYFLEFFTFVAQSLLACYTVTGKGMTKQLVFDYLCSVNAKFILRV
jgi:hypothetical protein